MKFSTVCFIELNRNLSHRIVCELNWTILFARWCSVYWTFESNEKYLSIVYHNITNSDDIFHFYWRILNNNNFAHILTTSSKKLFIEISLRCKLFIDLHVYSFFIGSNAQEKKIGNKTNWKPDLFTNSYL